jgi:hypothetical protein
MSLAIALALAAALLAHGALRPPPARLPRPASPPAPAAPAPRAQVIVLPSVVVPPPAAAPAPAAPAPAAPAPAAPAGPACPEPVRDAPPGAVGDPGLDPDGGDLRVAAARTDARWIAAWNHLHVAISGDGGARFRRVLDGPGRVYDVTFDCRGRVYVLRGGARVGVRDDAGERWHEIPGLAEIAPDMDDFGLHHARLAGGGPQIAVFGFPDDDDDLGLRAAIRDGHEGTWRYVDLGSPAQPVQDPHVDAAGTVHAVSPWTDGRTAGARRIAIDDGGLTRDEELGWHGSAHVHAGAGVYAHTLACDGTCWWPRPGARPRHVTGGPPYDMRGPVGVLVGGGAARLVEVDTVYRLDGGRARRVAAWPAGAEPMTVDAAGRVWGVDGRGQLVRSRR